MDTHRVGIFFGEVENTAGENIIMSDVMARLTSDDTLHLAHVHDPYGQEGQRFIKEVCEKESLEAAVVCGTRTPDITEFPLLSNNGSTITIPVFSANIMERCSWVHPKRQDAIEKAERILRIAAAKARRARPIALSTRPVNRTVMVVGGNHAAYQAALNLSSAGLEVQLLTTGTPDGCFFPMNPELLKAVTDDNQITIIENGRLRAISGQAGDFHILIEKDKRTKGVAAGAVVIAIDAEIDNETPGNSSNTVSLKSFLHEVEGGRVANDTIGILMDRDGPERRCAAEGALLSAKSHVEAGGKAYILFRNMPVYGKHGQKLYDLARAAGVQCLRYDENQPVIESQGGALSVKTVDAIVPDRMFTFQIDRLVLPGKIWPRLDNPAIAKLLRQPLDVEGFLQPGNIRHLPISSARKGVLFAGGCHSECDPFESGYEAEAVTSKVLSILGEETLTAPVEIVKVEVSKCASCLTCLRLCPHGAIEAYHDKKSVTILSGACWECGICAAACPGQAIEHGGLSKQQMSDVLTEATRELRGKRPTIIFACQQSAVPSLDAAGRLGLSLPVEATFIEVPCAGRVDETAMLEALNGGAQRVVVMGCHPSVCRSLKGNLVAAERVKRVRTMLSDSKLDPDRIQYHAIANNEPYRLVKLVTDCISPSNQNESAPSDTASQGAQNGN